MLNFTPAEKIQLLLKEKQDNLDAIVTLENQIQEKYSTIDLYTNTIVAFNTQIAELQQTISNLTINNEKINEMIQDYQPV